MISASQIKAARALLGWSAIELAKYSGVGSASIKRYEVQVGIPTGSAKNLFFIMKALEKSGIEFTGDPLKNPGVILHLKRDEQDE